MNNIKILIGRILMDEFRVKYYTITNKNVIVRTFYINPFNIRKYELFSYWIKNTYSLNLLS